MLGNTPMLNAVAKVLEAHLSQAMSIQFGTSNSKRSKIITYF